MSTRHSMKTAAAAAVALLATAGLAGCGSSTASPEASTDQPTVGFVNISMDTFGTCLQAGVESVAEAQGVNLLVANSNNDPAKEISNVEDMISRGVDAIILQTVNVDAMAGGISKAKAAGIPLYLTAILPDTTDDILGAAVVDLAGVGKLGAGWIAEDAAGAEAKVALISGVPGAASDIMMNGFKEALPAGITVVAEQPGMYNRGKAQDVAENIIQANPDLDYLFVQNEEMAFGASTALAAAGKSDVKIVTSNGTDEGLAAVESGQFAATVSDPAHDIGSTALTKTLEFLKSPSAEKVTKTNVLLVTKDNTDEAPPYCG